jgi:hypothetical protein
MTEVENSGQCEGKVLGLEGSVHMCIVVHYFAPDEDWEEAEDLEFLRSPNL